jgi:hypothetical protein
MQAPFMKHPAVAAVLVFAVMHSLSTGADAQTLGVALNATNLTWATSGTGGGQGWLVESITTEDGVSAAQSGTLPFSSSTSILQTTVTGPGTLTFWWYAPSAGQETLSLNVNGVTQASASQPMSSFQKQTNYLGSGSQTVKWIYSFAFVGDGLRGYVDEVTYTAGTTAPIITNQPLSQSQVQGLNNTFYIGAEGTPPLRYQWQFNGTDLSGATSSSYTVTNVQATNLGSYSVTVTNVAGTNHSADALLSFGNVTAWGLAAYGQTAVAPGATNVLSISGGWGDGLALRSDGTILAWGSDLRSDGTILTWGSDIAG